MSLENRASLLDLRSSELFTDEQINWLVEVRKMVDTGFYKDDMVPVEYTLPPEELSALLKRVELGANQFYAAARTRGKLNDFDHEEFASGKSVSLLKDIVMPDHSSVTVCFGRINNNPAAKFSIFQKSSNNVPIFEANLYLDGGFKIIDLSNNGSEVSRAIHLFLYDGTQSKLDYNAANLVDKALGYLNEAQGFL